ncbi:PEP-CTERM/exosortase system-associated acyltransferase [Pseudoalteromonas luteoviolacea]|uniref:PEP-CTERM/exosortase system-associated acyltransferase n=1 Tax=Pseudoalteromonas luteoviolacea NCIMB 1942 TaxID=1365253 RepID=A0A167C9H3_9GAMM|nr:PEP-CTERM/exosortase system-associated acyltransferase [Pseudoalteromonas luteoviolacea]KZN47400.1 hypothetical protein N482_09580 [Pseudoalteromonas luteoviolacea NCIMB 1942]KZW98803.1 hypothetical protein JL49_21110 [Pseudoalteromonas luteoviolacea]
MQVNSISEKFSSTFSIKLATTQAEKEISYGIRYQVYCSELNWEPKSSSKLESDRHDERALHLLLKHNECDQFIGCSRLITSPSAGQVSSLPCMHYLTDYQIEQHRKFFDQGCLGEASRFAILPQVRKKECETFKIDEYARPLMSAGMYFSNIALAKLLGMKGMLIFASPKVARRVEMLGLELTKISQGIDHNGSRAIYFLPVEQSPYLLQSNPKMIEFYNSIHTSIEPQVDGFLALNQAK